MPSITIRNVPEEARNELAGRAAASGRSLQEYLRRKIIELSEQPDAHAWASRVKGRKGTTGSSLPAGRILELLDESRK